MSEDKMLGDFERWAQSPNGNYLDAESAWKACAESYEKKLADLEFMRFKFEAEATTAKQKLAEKDAELVAEKIRIARGEYGQICGFCGWETKPEGASWEELEAHILTCSEHPAAALQKKLSEANARNAMLVEALSGVLPYVVTQEVACHGMKCREPVCQSCSSDSDIAAQKACDAYAKASQTISANSEAVAAWEAERKYSLSTSN